MTLKTCKRAMSASVLLAAFALSGGAFAAGASGDSYSFDGGGTLGAGDYTALTGNGTIVDGSHGVANSPMASAADTKVLEITGTVAYTNVTTSGSTPNNNASQVDLMFKVEPTDELEDIDDPTVQTALAVGEESSGTAPIKLWCKADSSSAAAGWAEVKTSVPTGSWVRATLVLDYSSNKCKISFNGDFAAEKTLAGTASQNYVKSITMIGSTQVDELVVKHEALETYNPYVDGSGNNLVVEASDGTDVTLKYLNDYGVSTNQVNTVLNENSGMTVAQKFEAGLNPKSDTKFELQTMTADSATRATVTFPGNKGSAAYEVTITDKNGGEVTGASASISSDTSGEGQNTATLTLPADADLVYINVKTK